VGGGDKEREIRKLVSTADLSVKRPRMLDERRDTGLTMGGEADEPSNFPCDEKSCGGGDRGPKDFTKDSDHQGKKGAGPVTDK